MNWKNVVENCCNIHFSPFPLPDVFCARWISIVMNLEMTLFSPSNCESLYQVSIKHKKCSSDCWNLKLVETWFYCTFLLLGRCWCHFDCVLDLSHLHMCWILNSTFFALFMPGRFIRYSFHAMTSQTMLVLGVLLKFLPVSVLINV